MNKNDFKTVKLFKNHLCERITKLLEVVLEVTFIFFPFHLLYFNIHGEIHRDLHTDILSVNLSNCALKVSISTLFQYLVNHYFKHIFPRYPCSKHLRGSLLKEMGILFTGCHGSDLLKILWPKFHVCLGTMIWITFHSSLKNELLVNCSHN